MRVSGHQVTLCSDKAYDAEHVTRIAHHGRAPHVAENTLEAVHPTTMVDSSHPVRAGSGQNFHSLAEQRRKLSRLSPHSPVGASALGNLGNVLSRICQADRRFSAACWPFDHLRRRGRIQLNGLVLGTRDSRRCPRRARPSQDPSGANYSIPSAAEDRRTAAGEKSRRLTNIRWQCSSCTML